MCPVYKATREESASPKAKANALRAVIDGRLPGEEGFRDAFEAVLRRCIHCGSCRRECPSGVDVPTLVLEARARYAERFGIPAADRLLTRLEEAARVAGPLIPLAAPALRSAAVRRLVERAAGVSARRDLLLPARRPLRMGPVRGSVSGTERVLFFTGCFARFVDPGIGRSAIQVLEALGAEVLLPEQHCCGLPLLSKGRVREAADKVRRNLRRWGPMLSSVDAVVVTCPSCGLALTEKWGALTDDPLLQDIREKTVPIGAFVTPRSDRLLLGRTSLDVAYHTPCHLRIQPDPEVSVRMLRTLEGAAVTPLRTHCCGMAGGWGMTADHYDLSVRMGEDLAGRLAASGADVAATDCPTCRMQIAHTTGLPVRHPVQIVADRLAAP
jgi:Fe-S oxidoreductase